jgi:hypothetical protein
VTFQALLATLAVSGIEPRGDGGEAVLAGNRDALDAALASEPRAHRARVPLDPAYPAGRPRSMMEVGALFRTPALARLAGAAGGGPPRAAMRSDAVPDPGATAPGPVESGNVD